MSTSNCSTTDCGSKHLRLMIAIISIVMTMCAGTIAYCRSTVAEIDARVRIVEQSEAANAARFEAIQQSLLRLEHRAEKS